MTSSITITRAARAAVRAALDANPAYDTTRERLFPGVTRATINKAQTIVVCDALGIDLAAIVAAANAAAPAPAVGPVTRALVDGIDNDDMGEGEALGEGEEGEGEEGETLQSKADRLLRDAFAPVAPFFSDKALASVRKGLQPLVDAYTKPPVIVARAPVVVSDGSCTIARTTLRKAFGIGRDDAATAYQAASYVPAVDPFYEHDADRLAVVNAAAERGDFVWLAGPAGTGKTTFALQYAAALSRPCFRIPFDKGMDVFELIGSRGIEPGPRDVWRDGVLTHAVQHPGAVIVLEELSFARPGVLAALQTSLDERAITLREDGGRVVRFAPGVMVLAADNTDGSGDQTGAYAGTEPMNVALMDRFALIVPCQYLAAKQETRALAAKAGIPATLAGVLVAFAGHVRKAQERGVMVHTMTLRRLVAMARALRDGASVDEAFAMAILPFFPATDREALVQLRMAHLDAAAITGAPAPATAAAPGATATAKGAAAASAFAAAPVATV